MYGWRERGREERGREKRLDKRGEGTGIEPGVGRGTEEKRKR